MALIVGRWGQPRHPAWRTVCLSTDLHMHLHGLTMR
jgi:hypothetical protein